MVEPLTPKEIEKAKDLIKKQDSPTQAEPDGKEKKEPEPTQESGSEEAETLPAPQPPGRPKNQGSQFEAFIRGDLPESISLDIEQFGYELFLKAPSSFAPVDLLPVGPDYLLGPGDELRIDIWGKVNAAHTVVLDRDGKIVLPQLGTLHVAGLTFAEAKDFIKKAFSRFYDPSEVKMNVSMGQLRSIRLFVVGKAAQPGSYTLSSFSSLINALIAAGGPSKVGSMRNILLKRKGETLVHFDLYDLLLKGDKRGDVRLMPEDVIFIPTVGPLIGIAGNVRAPAIYESKGQMTLQDLIEMAGGVSATGYLQRIQVERIFNNETKIILDIDLSGLIDHQALPLKDGDLVKIFSVNFGIANAVTLKGNVNRPGTYEWRPGMRLRDLIPSLSALQPDTYLAFALIERRMPPDQHGEYLSVGLKGLLIDGDEAQNILLEPHDQVLVYNRWDLMEKESVQLQGAVNKAGTFEYRPQMKLSDLFNLAGGLKRPEHPDSYLPNGMITRRVPPDFHEEKLSFDFKQALIEKSEAADLLLKPSDQVRIFDRWELAQENIVKISGAVQRPGDYPWVREMRIMDLLNLAGGAKDFASLDAAELTRISPTPEGPRIERIDISLQEAMQGKPKDNLLLQKDDYLAVRTVPEWALYRTVVIEGEVRFPGSYTTKKGERLSSLIERAGGFTANAYLKGAVFTRESVRALQQKQLDEAVDRLEHQLLSESAQTVGTALSSEAIQQQTASAEQRRALIGKMRAAKAKGRMAIQLDAIASFKDSPSDIILEDQDQLSVPERPQQIQVIGAVYNQTAFIHNPDTRVSHYLDKAGGLTENADEKTIYVLKVDGTAVSKQKTSGFWKRGLLSQTLDPGDTIVVPEEIGKIAWLREAKDITQILYQIAVTAGVLIVAF